MYGGFNDHTVHHFFPSVDHSHYGTIRKILLKTLSDYKIYYRMFTWMELVPAAFRVFTRDRPTKKADIKQD